MLISRSSLSISACFCLASKALLGLGSIKLLLGLEFLRNCLAATSGLARQAARPLFGQELFLAGKAFSLCSLASETISY